MAPYYPVTVCRSDGVQEYLLNGVATANCPKDIGRKPDAKGRVYNKLEPESFKGLTWKRKLGGMMMELIGGPDQGGKDFILKNLPDGYVLWEHAAETGEDGGDMPKTHKTTPGAQRSEKRSDTRSDTYLYGHPDGRTKRFRSPQDFFPHLLWLSMDKEGDVMNCSCKMCAPALKEVSERAEEMPVPMKKDPVIADFVPVKTEVPVPKPTPTPNLPRVTRSAEQNLDSEANGIYIYRPGELVWFNKGQAWGLAVICKRQAVNAIPRYLLQPLSHPLRHCAVLIKDQDSMRPWLAWSVPNTTHSQIIGLTYDQVPWERVVRGELGSGDAEVDGSILAAKAIDGSYTLFDRLEMPTAGAGEVYYNGMFLGAEKVWVSEPVRLRALNDDIVIMVILQMIERTVATTSSVTLIGDIYKLVEMPTPYKDRKDWPTPNLPARMVADLHFRNEVSENAKKGVWHEWRLLEPMARKTLPDVKGRWYETRALLPILRGPEYQNDISRGITSDAGVWMNARGDSSAGAGQRKRNRLDTLGRSVPPDLKISRGLNGPPSDDLFPDEQQRAQLNRGPTDQGHYGSQTEGEMDQFMNLDPPAEHQEFFGNSLQH